MARSSKAWAKIHTIANKIDASLDKGACGTAFYNWLMLAKEVGRSNLDSSHTSNGDRTQNLRQRFEKTCLVNVTPDLGNRRPRRR